jgi:hypothetical protein
MRLGFVTIPDAVVFALYFSAGSDNARPSAVASLGKSSRSPVSVEIPNAFRYSGVRPIAFIISRLPERNLVATAEVGSWPQAPGPRSGSKMPECISVKATLDAIGPVAR